MAYFAPVTVAPADAQQILPPDFLRDLPKELPKKITGYATRAKIPQYEVDTSVNPTIRPTKSPDPKLDERFNRQPGFYGYEIELNPPGTPEKDARGNPFPKYVAKYDQQGNFQEITTADKYFVTSGQGDKDTYVIPKIDLSGRLISMGSGTPEQAKKSIFRVLGETALEAAPAYLAALTGANLLSGAGLFGGGAGAAGAATGNAGALINAGMGGSAAQAASAAANLATTTAGLNAAVAAGGGLVPSTANFMSPDLISTAGGATPTTSTLGVTTAGVPTTPTSAPTTGAPTVGTPTTTPTSTGLFDDLLNKASSLTGIGKDTLAKLGVAGVQALLSSAGANKIADQAQQAAQTAADAQVRAAQIAADAARFRPVGVTTRFGSSNFGFDDKGNLITAGYTPTGEITGYQDRLRTLAGQGLTDVEAARTAYQPLTGAAQSLFTLGQSYLAKSPEQAAQDYITKQQALLAPTQENQLALLQNKLFQQGRTGSASAQGGNLMATNPEMAAYYNSIAQSNLALAAQADQEARNRIAFGGGLFNTGAGLQNQFYSGQTAAYAPFATAMDTSIGLENLAQQPLTLGTQIGAKTTASSAEAGRLLSSGITSAASTMYPSNAYSASGNLLSGVAQNPMVNSAINNAFGVQSSAPKYQIINGQLVQVS
jgi:hypothetical protein